MAKIDFGDGQAIELSKETTKRLRKELLKPAPPKDFKDGDFSIEMVGESMVAIDTDTPSRNITRIYRGLEDLVEIRNKLNVFVDYLKEIENE